jgi:hypothetical protein
MFEVKAVNLMLPVARALKRQDRDDFCRALRRYVEATIPNPRMPRQRIDTVWRRTGTPHVAWRWVSARGHVTLVVEAPAFRSLVVSVYSARPGVDARPHLLFRNETQELESLRSMLEQATRQLMQSLV